jgi:hypothetical protein
MNASGRDPPAIAVRPGSGRYQIDRIDRVESDDPVPGATPGSEQPSPKAKRRRRF